MSYFPPASPFGSNYDINEFDGCQNDCNTTEIQSELFASSSSFLVNPITPQNIQCYQAYQNNNQNQQLLNKFFSESLSQDFNYNSLSYVPLSPTSSIPSSPTFSQIPSSPTPSSSSFSYTSASGMNVPSISSGGTPDDEFNQISQIFTVFKRANFCESEAPAAFSLLSLEEQRIYNDIATKCLSRNIHLVFDKCVSILLSFDLDTLLLLAAQMSAIKKYKTLIEHIEMSGETTSLLTNASIKCLLAPLAKMEMKDSKLFHALLRQTSDFLKTTKERYGNGSLVLIDTSLMEISTPNTTPVLNSIGGINDFDASASADISSHSSSSVTGIPYNYNSSYNYNIDVQQEINQIQQQIQQQQQQQQQQQYNNSITYAPITMHQGSIISNNNNNNNNNNFTTNTTTTTTAATTIGSNSTNDNVAFSAAEGILQGGFAVPQQPLQPQTVNFSSYLPAEIRPKSKASTSSTTAKKGNTSTTGNSKKVAKNTFPKGIVDPTYREIQRQYGIIDAAMNNPSNCDVKSYTWSEKKVAVMVNTKFAPISREVSTGRDSKNGVMLSIPDYASYNKLSIERELYCINKPDQIITKEKFEFKKDILTMVEPGIFYHLYSIVRLDKSEREVAIRYIFTEQGNVIDSIDTPSIRYRNTPSELASASESLIGKNIIATRFDLGCDEFEVSFIGVGNLYKKGIIIAPKSNSNNNNNIDSDNSGGSSDGEDYDDAASICSSASTFGNGGSGKAKSNKTGKPLQIVFTSKTVQGFRLVVPQHICKAAENDRWRFPNHLISHTNTPLTAQQLKKQATKQSINNSGNIIHFPYSYIVEFSCIIKKGTYDVTFEYENVGSSKIFSTVKDFVV